MSDLGIWSLIDLEALRKSGDGTMMPLTIEDIEEVIQALKAYRATDNNGWRDISTAPRDGVQFIGLNENQGNVRYVCWWNKIHGYFTSTGGYYCQPTAWQPLPPPPALDKGE